MTTIKATCPHCGEVELHPDDIELAVCPTQTVAYYAFCCPSCHDWIRKDADDHIASLLISGGVKPQVWELPAEVLEPRSGPGLSYDDLLDFVLAMGVHDELAPLAAPGVHP